MINFEFDDKTKEKDTKTSNDLSKYNDSSFIF